MFVMQCRPSRCKCPDGNWVTKSIHLPKLVCFTLKLSFQKNVPENPETSSAEDASPEIHDTGK